ncbi:MAG: class I SAM-dependent methyltransferase [Gammaproteobacteria bacterium]|nr:class I SAM-dependent methyltransferase [Gammaproteobacteria bacterium]
MNNEPRQPTEAELWAGPMGDRWLAHYARFEGMIAPAGHALLAAAGCGPGEQVIDIGCGAGATSLDLARRVSPGGSVTGLDISAALVATCRARAHAAGLGNARFIVGDAAAVEVGGPIYDRLISRFGLMFFDHPYQAFQHLHGFLKAGGRLNFICWSTPEDNPWTWPIREIAQRYAPAPPPPPRAPGPWALQEPDYIRDILARAGFSDVGIDPWRGDQCVGGPGADPAGAAAFILESLGMADALRDRPAAVHQQALADLEAAYRPYHGPEGVRVPAAAWLVSARA